MPSVSVDRELFLREAPEVTVGDETVSITFDLPVEDPNAVSVSMTVPDEGGVQVLMVELPSDEEIRVPLPVPVWNSGTQCKMRGRTLDMTFKRDHRHGPAKIEMLKGAAAPAGARPRSADWLAFAGVVLGVSLLVVGVSIVCIVGLRFSLGHVPAPDVLQHASTMMLIGGGISLGGVFARP